MYARPLNQPKAGVQPFVFSQDDPSAVWRIEHNLGRHVQVTLVDSSGGQMLAETNHVDLNTVEVRLGEAGTGKAFII